MSSAEYQREWRTKNADRCRAYGQKWREENREHCRAKLRERREKFPEKVKAEKAASYRANPEKYKAYARRSTLKKYGLTEESFRELFDRQGQRCGVCGGDDPQSLKGWHVDHCHGTGIVRGILCNHCNLMLGYAKDNSGALIKAAAYLEKAR